MKGRRITQIIMLATAAVWLVWDVIVAISPETGDTESETARDYSIYPAWPALWGGLAGHWFLWEVRVVPGMWGMACAIGMIFLLGGWSVLTKNQIGPEWLFVAHRFASRHPAMICAMAMFLGGLFWGLAPSTKTLN
jgi:hypothetical protein